MIDQRQLEGQLNSFDLGQRQQALTRLAQDGRLPAPAAQGNVNMHFHSFFSYNAEGWSPSRIAWEARKAGLYAAALCDFDVLDGLEEFLQAGHLLSLRTAVHLETRAYFKEYATVDISSPGEPGVTYIMGGGFVRPLAAGSAQATGLAGYRDRARVRNLALIGRINARLAEIALDYDRDVLPLTPAGVATERHIITAYIAKSKSVFKTAEQTVHFWSALLGKGLADTAMLMADPPTLEEAVRSKLAKKGGIGYEQPSVGTFPPVDDFVKWVLACDAVPMITWLDGTSGGEKDARAMLECLRAKGAAALNIIPDRNWNIANPEQRAVKQANLKAMVEAAELLDLPVNIGTEMNRLGLPFVDDLTGAVLKAYRQPFLNGARIMVGHTLLARYADCAYTGRRAAALFADVKARNLFFGAVGGLPPMDAAQAGTLAGMGPEKALDTFRDAVRTAM